MNYELIKILINYTMNPPSVVVYATIITLAVGFSLITYIILRKRKEER